MPKFNPNPGDVLRLPCVGSGSSSTSLPYSVEPSSLNKSIAHASEGGKAIIYRLLRTSDKTHWALKKFKPRFSNEEILHSSTRLTALIPLPGFKAATRSVIPPDHQIVAEYSDLKWAVLMPWVSGQTCFDLFGICAAKNKNGHCPLPVAVAIAQARRLVEIEGRLEFEGYAHTDISSANFVLDYDARVQSRTAPSHDLDSQLIDIEDVWFPGIQGRNSFTDGYGHRSLREGATTACAEGDRYSTVILTAELLLLTSHDIAKKFEAGGYFQDNCTNPQANLRYEEAQKYLKGLCPDFADALAQAWRSHSLDDCSRISDLLPTLKEGTSSASSSIVTGLFGKTPVLNSAPVAQEPAKKEPAPTNLDNFYNPKPGENPKPVESKPVQALPQSDNRPVWLKIIAWLFDKLVVVPLMMLFVVLVLLWELIKLPITLVRRILKL